MRVGPEIKRGAGRMWEGDPATLWRGFDFLELFGSFWGDVFKPSFSGAKKNKTFEVKLRFKFALIFRSELLF